MSAVRINNLTVSYGEKAVFDNFNFEFAENKINVILGGSGVGKTTLLNAMAGLIRFDGEIKGTQDGVSFIFQKDRLIPSISIYKNLDLILRSVYKNKKERAERIEKMLALLEITEQAEKLPTEISGGQAQRVAMARAFLYPSEVLLMDEPFKALDTALKSRLISALIDLNEKSPRTIIFVTHAVDECLLSADNWCVLGGSPASVVEKGEIPEDKRSRKLSDEGLAEVRKNLLSALGN